MLGLELRKVPADDAFRMRPDAARARRRVRGRRDRRHDLDDLGRPGRGDRRPLRAGGRLAARRRGVRRLGDGLPRAALGVRGRRARRLARRQPAQVAVHADGLLAALDAPAGGVPRRVLARARVPARRPTRARRPQRVRARARPPLPRAEAVGGPALLRRGGPAGADPRGVRLAELFEGWVRDEPGWELCAPRPFSLVCFRREGSDEENEAILERVNASGEFFISHTKLSGRLRAAARDRQRAHDRGRRARAPGTC